jgi:IS30 family transposase
MGKGRPINKELRKQIASLLRQGKSQAEIGRIVERKPGTISHYVRERGIERKQYTTPAPILKGKRRCASCGKRKSLGAYPNDRGAECTMCIRAKGDTK